jgi:hypothetical protein
MGYCGGYEFATTKEDSVDYVVLVDDEPRALCEAKSPSVMKKTGDLLPPHGIELTWIRGQPLVPKLLAKVSMPIPVGYNIGFKETCADRIVSGSETNEVAVSYLLQLLDCVPSCEGRQPPLSCVLAKNQH